jgi:type VI secretion system protein
VSDRGLLGRLRSGRRSVDQTASIAANVSELLNARQGLAETAPAFGVVDFNDVVHNMDARNPDGLRTLQHSIRATLLEHEPRLQSVTVRQVPAEDPLLIRFEVVGRLTSDRRTLVRLHTELRAGGVFTVK